MQECFLACSRHFLFLQASPAQKTRGPPLQTPCARPRRGQRPRAPQRDCTRPRASARRPGHKRYGGGDRVRAQCHSADRINNQTGILDGLHGQPSDQPGALRMQRRGLEVNVKRAFFPGREREIALAVTFLCDETCKLFFHICNLPWALSHARISSKTFSLPSSFASSWRNPSYIERLLGSCESM